MSIRLWNIVKKLFQLNFLKDQESKDCSKNGLSSVQNRLV